jgi:predicted RNA-binding Zn-ribbon protein involved in translation (DUF1610 family)
MLAFSNSVLLVGAGIAVGLAVLILAFREMLDWTHRDIVRRLGSTACSKCGVTIGTDHARLALEAFYGEPAPKGRLGLIKTRYHIEVVCPSCGATLRWEMQKGRFV